MAEDLKMMVVIEGVDASGKETQTKMLKERLESIGRQVVVYSFPRYETPVGKAIKRHLTGHIAMMRPHTINSSVNQTLRIDGDTVWRTADKDAMAFQCLMLADKCEAASSIRADLGHGRVVVCDRWWQSALAFGKADGLDAAWLYAIHTGLPRATVNIFIDVPTEEALRRRPEVRDRYERDREKQSVVRQNYESMWRGGGPDYVTVDGVGTVDEVHARIWEAIGAEGELEPPSTSDEELIALARTSPMKLNYAMGWGRYQEAPGVSLVEGGEPGRKFELFGRAAVSAVAYYDGEDRKGPGWAFGVSWLGEEIRNGRVLPIDGTPE